MDGLALPTEPRPTGDRSVGLLREVAWSPHPERNPAIFGRFIDSPRINPQGTDMTRSRLIASCIASGAIAQFMVQVTSPGFAAQGGINGAWSGAGSVYLANGRTEKARCRATFREISSSAFAMSAVCATTSARVNQTARLRATGANSWSGQFHNSEYNADGSIDLVLHGQTLRASLQGNGAHAVIVLRR